MNVLICPRSAGESGGPYFCAVDFARMESIRLARAPKSRVQQGVFGRASKRATQSALKRDDCGSQLTHLTLSPRSSSKQPQAEPAEIDYSKGKWSKEEVRTKEAKSVLAKNADTPFSAFNGPQPHALSSHKH